jgi:hypothetical protein
MILVNDGKRVVHLIREMEHLRGMGFRVFALFGGLNYWRIKGMPLKGDAFAIKDLNKIDPEICAVEKIFDRWLIIDISGRRTEDHVDLVHHGITIPFDQDKAAFLSQWTSIMAQHDGNAFLSILVFDRDGEGYEQIENLLKETGEQNVFFLRGGLEGYQAFMLKKQKQPKPKRLDSGPSPCATCSQ